jgi:hypothetical protein
MLRKTIFLPQDHGSWVFIFSPLLIGLFAGGRVSPASGLLILAALTAFLIRQPVTIAVKAIVGRRSESDLPAARAWIVIYGAIILVSVTGLIALGDAFVLILAVPALPVFAWHLYLVSKRSERRQAGVEVIAVGALSLAAPAAFWVGIDRADPAGWWLWALIWFQSAASIVYAYLRLEQRELKSAPDRSTRWRMGRRSFLYTGFNFAAALVFSFLGTLPQWIFVPFLLQFVETLYGIFNPAVGYKPTAIGFRQLIVSALFTLLFVLAWRLG